MKKITKLLNELFEYKEIAIGIEKEIASELHKKLVEYCMGYWNKRIVSIIIGNQIMKLKNDKLMTLLENIGIEIELNNNCRNNELKELVDYFIDKFRKYCHFSDCNNTNDCPKKHENCSEVLELNTAIAWEIAKVLETLYAGNIDIECVQEIVSVLLKTVELHYYRFPELNKLLDELNIALEKYCSIHWRKY